MGTIRDATGKPVAGATIEASSPALRSKVLLTGNLGVYNVLNRNDVLTIQTTYGGQWLKPTRVMDARLFQVSARLDF